jgi:hypothetical protein
MANPMRRKLGGLAVAGACSIIVAAGSAPKVHAQTWDKAGVNAQNVVMIDVPYDQFRMTEPGCSRDCQWVEKGEVALGGQSYNFVERNRDENSIYLFDDSRQVLLQFDLSRRQVLWIPPDRGQRPQKIFDITRASAGGDRHNRNVTLIEIPNDQFRMTEPGRDGRPSRWIEQGQGNNFVEQGRDEHSIYLSDASRGVRLQFDLSAKQVFYISSDANIARQPLYPITRVSTHGSVDDHNSRTITLLEVPNGQFRMSELGRDGRQNRWVEQGQGDNSWQANNFLELGRDDNSIYLSDASRGVKLQFDLPAKQVFYISSDANVGKQPLYPITRVSTSGGAIGSGQFPVQFNDRESQDRPSWCTSQEKLNLAERTICDSPTLSALDNQLGKAYKPALRSGETNRAEERQWVGARDGCRDDQGCLRALYDSRIGKIRAQD